MYGAQRRKFFGSKKGIRYFFVRFRYFSRGFKLLVWWCAGMPCKYAYGIFGW